MKRFLSILCAIAAVVLPSVAQARSFSTVVIDPGHGGHDVGGRNGLVYEKHLALDTATRLETYLKSKGIRTVMTRRSDYFVTLPGRVAIAKQYRNAIFVSVHYNYSWKEDPCGLETYYYSAESAPLASFVQSGILRKVRASNRGAKFARFFVLRNAPCPAILVECGFVSNSSECEHMKRAWFRQGLAEGIGEGIMRYRSAN